MFIVADSGSTKTNWTIIDKGRIIHFFRTNGFNPYFVNHQTITKKLTLQFPHEVNIDQVQNIYFYGAGCSSKQTKKIIFKGCSDFFTQAKIIIENDLLGAARAVFFNQKGIITIMGTGSNTGTYNGAIISCQSNSLGFAFDHAAIVGPLRRLLLLASVRGHSQGG